MWRKDGEGCMQAFAARFDLIMKTITDDLICFQTEPTNFHLPKPFTYFMFVI